MRWTLSLVKYERPFLKSLVREYVMRTTTLTCLCLLVVSPALLCGDDAYNSTKPTGDAALSEYFALQVAEIENATFEGIETLEDWEAKRGEYRRQLAEMLGLDPMPPKTPLKPVVTGTVEHDEFTLEKLHFQSSPGLYVTGSLYLPKELDKPAPTILYVCGHGRVKEDGISYGNKATYQHHGIWFARHGYVCLIIDTLQLGEIEGLHHGTYREGMWWWHERGYTPAGVEAWNCIRALDYLETRDEVDAERFGVTGRSGGGAYSWWIAALDERIKAAVPVAGITSLRNHLLGPFQSSPWSRGDTRGHDGCIEGHCDCMFFNNTYRWDFPMVAALVAPRALLISNTDKDRIFPLDGVYDVYNKTQKIYELYGATENLGLQICEGPHKDTQQLRVHAFGWMNRHLKGEEPLIDVPAEKLLEPQQVRVFDELPADEINTRIHETFVPAAPQPEIPQSSAEWDQMRSDWMQRLRESVFAGWPAEDEAPPLELEQVASTTSAGMQLRTYRYTSQQPHRLDLLLATGGATAPSDLQQVVVIVVDEQGWPEFAARTRGIFPGFLPDSGIEASAKDLDEYNSLDNFLADQGGIVALLPRGVGPSAWTDHETERLHIKRRYALLGQTLDGMRAFDVLRGLQAAQNLAPGDEVRWQAEGEGDAADWLLAASLFDDRVSDLRLKGLAAGGNAVFLNARRVLPQGALLLMAAGDAEVHVVADNPDEWSHIRRISEQPWFGSKLRFDTPRSE
jgi:cephalosporin-C deacetylase-like acetyl esterase